MTIVFRETKSNFSVHPRIQWKIKYDKLIAEQTLVLNLKLFLEFFAKIKLWY